jgi:hypothetical protein
MKNNILLFGLVFVILLGCKKNEITRESTCSFTDFLYYRGKKEPIGEMSGDYITVGIDTINKDDKIRSFIKQKDYLDQDYKFDIIRDKYSKYIDIALKLKQTSNCNEIAWILNDIKQNSIIEFANFTIKTDDCDNYIFEKMGELCVRYYGNFFYVSVKDTSNISDLKKIILETDTKFGNYLLSNLYLVYTNKNSKGDAIKMANYFYESGLFEYTEVGFGRKVVIH